MIYPSISSYEDPFLTVTPKFLKPRPKPSLRLLKPILCFQNQNPNTINRPTFNVTPNQVYVKKRKKHRVYEEKRGFPQVGSQQMLTLCGFGYWVQGFRCFPWLALNFHMAHNLNLQPSTLQLVQSSANLPMVAKPIYGILSDAIYIGGAHRIPYISIGVLLQVLSWVPLALIPTAREVLPTLMACALLSNLGASVTEVANDALIAEYGQKHKIGGLQSYAFMALATGGILGNLIGGYFLLKTPPRTMFLMFSVFLFLQLAISFSTAEESLGVPQLSDYSLARKSISSSIRKQLSDLVTAIGEESISRPLIWIVTSIAMVPILSGLAEILAQFKLLPFLVLFASLCPQGCEGSLTSFLASTWCLSSIISGFLGVGLASVLGITSGDYSGLTVGILIQFLAALVPLRWVHDVPITQPVGEKGRKSGISKRTRRNRRVGRVLGSIYAYRRERDSETEG
ncbi:FBT8 [Quillaja saponaria]|uniref:FBT8 n=1 Tax=Quillaja saponaria TaxID=32244 RepID=A0AAD7VLF5_QUISA|nr:FBT8 [Quillaja saponaria]